MPLEGVFTDFGDDTDDADFDGVMMFCAIGGGFCVSGVSRVRIRCDRPVPVLSLNICIPAIGTVVISSLSAFKLVFPATQRPTALRDLRQLFQRGTKSANLPFKPPCAPELGKPNVLPRRLAIWPLL